MKEQIEEMAKDISQIQTCGIFITESQMDSRNSYSREIKNKEVAEHLYNAGYRKQKFSTRSFEIAEGHNDPRGEDGAEGEDGRGDLNPLYCMQKGEPIRDALPIGKEHR